MSFFGTLIKDSGESANRMEGKMWYWLRLKGSRTRYEDCSGLYFSLRTLGVMSKVIIECRSHHRYTGYRKYLSLATLALDRCIEPLLTSLCSGRVTPGLVLTQ